MHNGLKILALDAGSEFRSAQIRLNSEVVDLDCENGTLTLANGISVKKRLSCGSRWSTCTEDSLELLNILD